MTNPYFAGPSITLATASIWSGGAFLASSRAIVSFLRIPDWASTMPNTSWKRRTTRRGARIRGRAASDWNVALGFVNMPIRVAGADLSGASLSKPSGALDPICIVSAFMLSPSELEVHIQAKVERYRNGALHRSPLLGAGSELKAVHGVDRGFDQDLRRGRLRHPDADHAATLVHVRVQNDRTLAALRPGQRRVLRNHAIDDPGRRIEGVED